MGDVRNGSNASSPPSDIYFRLIDLRCDLFNTAICHLTALLWCTVPYVLFALGTVCNTLSFVTLSRRGVRGLTVSIYLRFLAVMDTFVIWIPFLRITLLANTGYDIAVKSDVVCKLVEWMTFVSGSSSAWLLVAVSVERLVVTKFPAVKSKITKRSTLCIAMVICFICALYCGTTLFGFGLVVFDNKMINGNVSKVVHHKIDLCSFVSESYFRYYTNIGTILNAIFVPVLPILLITTSNVVIIITLRNQQKKVGPNLTETGVRTTGNIQVAKLTRARTKMLVIVSGYFIISISPLMMHDVVVRHLHQSLTSTDLVIHQLLRCIFSIIGFSNYCINFFLYLKRGPVFAREWKSLKSDLRRYVGRLVSSHENSSSVIPETNLTARSPR